MNQNRNIIWVAVVGVVIVLVVAYLLARPQMDARPAAMAPAGTMMMAPATTNGEPPLAPAVPVLPPETGAAPTAPAPSDAAPPAPSESK